MVSVQLLKSKSTAYPSLNVALFRVQWNTLDAMLNEVSNRSGEEGKPFELIYKGHITTATIAITDSAPDPFLDIDSVVG